MNHCGAERPHGDLSETLRQVLSRVRRNLQAELATRDLDLSLPEAHILHLIHHQPEVSPQELAQQSGYDKAVIARKIKCLQDRGWLKREKDAEDNRRLRLQLTPPGEDGFCAVEAARAVAHDQVFAALNQDDQLQLARLLQKCLAD